MDPNMVQQPQYADVISGAPPQTQQQQQQQQDHAPPPPSSTTTSSINYGKRHAAPLVVTPRKHMNHPIVPSSMNVLSYSNRATPPPAKVFHGHTPLTPPPTPDIQGSAPATA